MLDISILSSNVTCALEKMERNSQIPSYNSQHSFNSLATSSANGNTIPQVIIHRVDSPTLPSTEMPTSDTREACNKKSNPSNDFAINSTGDRDVQKVIFPRFISDYFTNAYVPFYSMYSTSPCHEN